MTLFHKYIVVTNDIRGARFLKSSLLQQGARVISAPCLKTIDPACYVALDHGIKKLHSLFFTHVIITSQNSLRFLYRRMLATRFDRSIFTTVKVVAVGPKTARLVKRLLKVSPIEPNDTVGAEDLMAKLELLATDKIFFPKSSMAMPSVEKHLAAANIFCYAADAYRVVNAEPHLLFLGSQRIDAICFMSPSAVKFFLDAFYKCGHRIEILDDVAIACIGKTTATYARAQGLFNIVVADVPEISSLVDHLRGYFSDLPAPPRPRL